MRPRSSPSGTVWKSNFGRPTNLTHWLISSQVGKDGRVKEPPKPKPEKPAPAPAGPDPDDETLDDLSKKAITDVFGENLNLLDDAGRKLLGLFLRKAPKPPGAGDKVKVHQETDNEAIRTDYLKLNWDDYTYTRTRKRKAVQAPT